MIGQFIGENTRTFTPERRTQLGLTPEWDNLFRARALAALDYEQLRCGKLARVLHDEVAQMLSAVGLQLDILRMDLDCAAPEFAARTAQIQEFLDTVVKQVRDLSYELSPGIVERAGLQLALDMLTGRFRKSYSGNLRLIYDSSARVLLPEAIALERIAEEAVTNAIRHARCNQIEIIVKSGRSSVAMEVRDDGIGFDYEAARKHPTGLGLSLIEYWGAKAGLRIDVRRNDGPGTTLSVLPSVSPESNDTSVKGSVYAA